MSNERTFSVALLQRLIVGTLLEFGPIIIFLLSFQHFHVYKATMLLMIATIITTFVTYTLQKRLPYLGLYLAFLTIGFGYLTLLHREPRFIQMRDTLYDLTCAVTLLIGLMIQVPFLKIASQDIIPMTTRAWNKLTHAWIGFFLVLAVLNEYVRRTYTLDVWFDFKTAMVLVTILFGFTAIYLCYEKEHVHTK